METANIHVRVPKANKEQAVAKLRSVGMDLSTAINIFIAQVIRQDKFPVEIQTDYQYPQWLYDALDEDIENHDETEYMTLEECFARWRERLGAAASAKV